MVVLLPDHGTRYLGKVYNDSWMKDHGYLEKREYATAQDILKDRNGSSDLVTVPQEYAYCRGHQDSQPAGYLADSRSPTAISSSAV